MRILIKIGSNLIQTEEGDIDLSFIASLARSVKSMMKEGDEVIIVSSGAVLCGAKKLGREKPVDLRTRQAFSAIGQAHLMYIYDSVFNNYGIPVGQVLLTSDIFSKDNDERFKNAKATLERLIELGVVPVINENDAVAINELVFGDNDFLAVYVGFMLGVDLLVILSSAGGLLDHKGKVIPIVESVDSVMDYVKGTGSEFGSGGMRSKLEATRLATSIGVPVVITGKHDDLLRVKEFKTKGTIFQPAKTKVREKQKLIAMLEEPKGIIYIDDGAVKALRGGKSLLPAGVIHAEGSFSRGDVVTVANAQGIPVGKGKSNFSVDELIRIKGLKGKEAKKLLNVSWDEVIHRDNLVVFT
jgi:glutamate 5-kinase